MRKSLVYLGVLITILAVSTCFSMVSAVQTKTLIAIADSYVTNAINAEKSNYGGQSYLQVSNSENMFTGESLAYIMFDLTEIPSGVTVKSAKLRLHTSFGGVTSTHVISVYHCPNNEWNELSITWSNKPAFSDTPLSSVAVSKGDTWYEWNVTSAVQSALSTSGKKLSLVLGCEYYESADWIQFHSRDQQYSWMEEYKPQLVVEYEGVNVPSDNAGDVGAAIGGLIFIVIIILIIAGVVLLIKRRSKQKKATT